MYVSEVKFINGTIADILYNIIRLCACMILFAAKTVKTPLY